VRRIRHHVAGQRPSRPRACLGQSAERGGENHGNGGGGRQQGRANATSGSGAGSATVTRPPGENRFPRRAGGGPPPSWSFALDRPVESLLAGEPLVQGRIALDLLQRGPGRSHRWQSAPLGPVAPAG